MRLLLAISLWISFALPVWADARLTQLLDLMRMEEGIAVLHTEGLDYAAELDRDMLNGQGGAAFAQQAAAIFDQTRMSEQVRDGFVRAFDPETLEQAIAFYATPVGMEIARLEVAARAAIIDPVIEEAAIARYLAGEEGDQHRLALLERFEAVNDLVERNVIAGMNDQVKFMTGLMEGGALDLTEEDILTAARADMETLYTENRNWLMGYGLLAYSPLSDAEFEAYVLFSETPAGQAVNQALFDGFGAAYSDIYFALGRVIALNMMAREL